MSRITIHEFERPEVELPDAKVYRINVATKSVVAAVEKAEEKIEAAENADALVAAYCELFDLRLEPVEPKQAKASTTVKRLWDTQKIGLPHLIRLSIDIGATDSPF